MEGKAFLEGRKQVTLAEIRLYAEKRGKRKKSLRDMVEITNEGISEDGTVQYYHFEMEGIPCIYLSEKVCLENCKMTEREKRFAEGNIMLLYKFMNSQCWSFDEYYDVVLFGYLKAVVKYCRLEKLKKYAFSTIAYRDMKCACYHHLQKRQKREEIQLFSLERLKEEGMDWVDYECLNAKGQERKMNVVISDIWQELGVVQKKIIMLIRDGYNICEIARILRLTESKVYWEREKIVAIGKKVYGIGK